VLGLFFVSGVALIVGAVGAGSWIPAFAAWMTSNFNVSFWCCCWFWAPYCLS